MRPLGDEISAPYFVRADARKPVQMVPIARYVQANLNPIDNGRTTKFSGGRQTLYRFPPDEQLDDIPDDAVDNAIYTENQKTFPKIYAGTTSFNPTAAVRPLRQLQQLHRRRVQPADRLRDPGADRRRRSTTTTSACTRPRARAAR